MITGSRRIKDLIRNRAKGDSAKAQMLLRHFAMERLLERLSVSPYKNDFILKGGMLLSSIVGVEERMTRDIDATMRGHAMNLENVARIINEISSIDIGDGFTFEPGGATEIMEDSEYGGIRIPMTASIERTKTTFKIDVSTGDAITPDAVEHAYQLMFENRSISLRSYNDETFLSEKLETILSLATQNTRMRDFYDIWALRASGREIDYALLGSALEATRTARKSAATINDFERVFTLLQESAEMADAWRRYQLSNPFAESVNWQDALAALDTIAANISSCLDANLDTSAPWRIWRLAEHPGMTDEAAAWFSEKWDIPEKAYRESMRESARAGGVPQWYVVREDNEPAGAIIAGCGIIENDFHDRPDLAPNLCALYVEEEYRHHGLARHLLNHARAEAAAMGHGRLYLVTDLVGFYEKCSWEYLGDVNELEGGTIRLYGTDTLS
ncbi:nucleotidyl transferase AbiEii/AbiGii toxin family protein [Adlercreutzia shanghongiae]|uniref:Nucleotidyl transferase AbiEii/AbiGii toxin family protein n=1 Tax=Adlercreutzia shanghongiae TaxID=3111773 RepID=A0ABU6IVU8_9ACTN|nr:nucleotidyl transferase AbiEii/AbiGii toxin family protein [Adlercreutzia sp. R22]MEC4293959.1 nucleotidyl transferase AbiEii/AbiGii toxin family protein [Adlercreutzia sp. R22]